MIDRLSIAIEPEVAVLYCALFHVDKLTGCSQDEETSQHKTFSPGEQCLIVDLGGTLHYYIYMSTMFWSRILRGTGRYSVNLFVNDFFFFAF